MPNFLQDIQQSDVAAVQERIKYGVNVNQPCSNGELPLKIAIQQIFLGNNPHNTIKIFDLLLEAGADPNKVVLKVEYSNEDETLLHYLCRQGVHKRGFFHRRGESKSDPQQIKREAEHRELALLVVKKLLAGKHSININVFDKFHSTPLFTAIYSKNFALAKLLLTNGAEATTITAAYNETVLHAAVDAKANSDFIQKLLEHKLDVNAKNKQGRTALDNALDSHPDTILFLLKQGAQAASHDMLDFFAVAQDHNHADLLNYLFEQGIAKYCNKRHRDTALRRAKSDALIERLLQAGAAIHLQGEGFFHLFLNWFLMGPVIDRKNEQQRLDLLREYKADFCVTDQAGNTLLHESVDRGLPLCQFLIKQGVAINAVNHANQTALHRAAEMFQIDVMKFLLEHHADPAIIDKQGLTALEYLRFRVFGNRDHANPDNIWRNPIVTQIGLYTATGIVTSSDICACFKEQCK